MGDRIIFDIETNQVENFRTLEGLHTIHCIAAYNIDRKESRAWGPDEISDALTYLEMAETLIGHNIQRFDIPALNALCDWVCPLKILDTLHLARMAFPEIRVSDFSHKTLPTKHIGSHSLKAWGYRLGILKGDYGDQEDAWETFTPEMLAYCKQDVEVNLALWEHLPELPEDAVQLEHDFGEIIRQQEINGFAFDTEKAQRLYARLAGIRNGIKQELVELVPPTVIELKTKTKTIPFNPDSRPQIAKHLVTTHGWKPKDWSPSGKQPKVDETVLEALPYPEAKKIARYLMLSKRIGQIAEGKEAWLKVVENGRIHGRVNTIGAVTARCTHSKPNVSQVPAVRKPLGRACRSCFTTSGGRVLVGVDVSGLELRCLAHYMARYDGGRYARILLEDDIHTANQKAAGLTTRDQAKTFIYAFLYGAGDEKIGTIVGGGADEGRRLKRKFLKNLPALKNLKEDVSARVKSQGFLRAIDGRPLPIRSAHSALNTLLQSCGAIIVKRATVIAADRFRNAGAWNQGVHQVAHIHDEVQYEVEPHLATTTGETVVQSIVDAGEHYNLRCPLTGEYRIGRNWKETH